MNGPDALDVFVMLAVAALVLAIFLGILLATAQARHRRAAAALAGVGVGPDGPPLIPFPHPPNTFADSHCSSDGGDGGCGGD